MAYNELKLDFTSLLVPTDIKMSQLVNDMIDYMLKHYQNKYDHSLDDFRIELLEQLDKAIRLLDNSIKLTAGSIDKLKAINDNAERSKYGEQLTQKFNPQINTAVTNAQQAVDDYLESCLGTSISNLMPISFKHNKRSWRNAAYFRDSIKAYRKQFETKTAVNEFKQHVFDKLISNTGILTCFYEMDSNWANFVAQYPQYQYCVQCRLNDKYYLSYDRYTKDKQHPIAPEFYPY